MHHIAAVLVKASAPAPSITANSASYSSGQVADNSDDPAAPHEAGIYYYNESAPAGSKMLMLEGSPYLESKTGGIFKSAMTYGIAKFKMKEVIRGARSNVRITTGNPVFYFYFEQHGARLSYGSSFGGASSPNEFTLLKLDVKGETRETVTASANAFGASSGTDDKAISAFKYTKLHPGMYKAVMSVPLQPGEYGFFSASRNVFDFGID